MCVTVSALRCISVEPLHIEQFQADYYSSQVRKANKLAELMDKLNLASEEGTETDTGALPDLPSFSLLGNMQTVGSGNLAKPTHSPTTTPIASPQTDKPQDKTEHTDNQCSEPLLVTDKPLVENTNSQPSATPNQELSDPATAEDKYVNIASTQQSNNVSINSEKGDTKSAALEADSEKQCEISAGGDEDLK